MVILLNINNQLFCIYIILHLDYKNIDAHNTKLKDSSFDYVIAAQVLHHIPYPIKFFKEMHRILKKGGVIAFEVGEVKKGTIKLEEELIPVIDRVGFNIKKILINKQNFTKTANIWGVNNNSKGTNTNRILLITKE